MDSIMLLTEGLAFLIWFPGFQPWKNKTYQKRIASRIILVENISVQRGSGLKPRKCPC